MCASERRQHYGAHRMASQPIHTTSHLRIASTPPSTPHLASHCVYTIYTTYTQLSRKGLDFVLAFLITTASVCLFRCAAAHHDCHHRYHRHSLCSGFRPIWLLLYARYLLSEPAFDISGRVEGPTRRCTSGGYFFPLFAHQWRPSGHYIAHSKFKAFFNT
jgi:hypothetical protein